jgi:hydroxymethylpyrimidine pyrophosphatase-like HAD family hydrolase
MPDTPPAPLAPPDTVSRTHRLILATDLDGTFLGGSAAERSALYDYLQAWRDRLLLVFVTGRDLAFIRALTADGWVPEPDFVIGDVGTTVVDGRRHQPLEPVQGPIERLWGGSTARVKALLADEPGLALQPVMGDRRVSYYYDPATLRPETIDKVRAAGFDVILSAGVYFDVMPRGVAKGPTLLRFVETLSLDPARVLVAGDTMNDLSLFETGLDGVAVGNSEPELVARIGALPTVHHSPHDGCAGIADAIRRFGKTLED